MQKQPLVSTVIIFLNGERYIEEAIESVFAQTYDNWELLLADDGSTDSATAIARGYAERHPEKVRYLEHPGHQNRGMSATRNLGFRHAKGEYIALLDADDAWLPHKLEQQVAVLNAQPEAGMLYAPTLYWYSWTGRPEDAERDYVPVMGVPPDTLVRPPHMLVHYLNEVLRSPGTCSVLMRRGLIEAVGGFEERFRGMYEDQAFFAKASLEAPVYVIGDYSAKYRQHPESACHVAADNDQYRAAEDRYLTWLAGYVAQRKGGGPAMATLRQTLWPYQHPTLHRAIERVRASNQQAGSALDWIVRRRLLT